MSDDRGQDAGRRRPAPSALMSLIGGVSRAFAVTTSVAAAAGVLLLFVLTVLL